MAITDLTGTKWQIDVQPLQPTLFPTNGEGNIVGTVTNNELTDSPFNRIYFTGGAQKIIINVTDGQTSPVAVMGFWQSSGGIPTISISGGTDVANADVIAWFEANATQIIDPPATEPFLSKTGLSRVWQNIQTYLNKLQEKLVSGVNVKTVNNESLLGSGNIEIGGVFLATYGETTYNDVLGAINANKIIILKIYTGGETYILTPCGTGRLLPNDGINGRIWLYSLRDETLPPELYAMAISLYTIRDDDTWSVVSMDLQEALVSGTSIKTINNKSLLGSGNLDIGFHVAVNQEKWVGTYTDENNVVYQVYSKQIYIPALPDTPGVTTYEHGIENIKQILDIYGSTTDGFVLNAPRQTVTDNITIYQASKSASNKTFSIEVGKDRSSKKAYVTVVYAKNN